MPEKGKYPAHLEPYRRKKGDPKIPGSGRPKKKSFETILQQQLDKTITVREDNQLSQTTMREHIAFKFIEALADGEAWAYKEFLGREWLQKTIIEHVVSGDDTERIGDALKHLLARSSGVEESADDDADGDATRH